MFDRSAIAKEAHRIARIYGPSRGYRVAMSWGFRDAWQSAKDAARLTAFNASLTAEARARRDEAIAIQCSTDGALSAAAITRLNELAHAA